MIVRHIAATVPSFFTMVRVQRTPHWGIQLSVERDAIPTFSNVFATFGLARGLLVQSTYGGAGRPPTVRGGAGDQETFRAFDEEAFEAISTPRQRHAGHLRYAGPLAASRCPDWRRRRR